MVDEIGLFDVDWLAGTSFALLTPKYTDALSLAKELNEILGDEHSAAAGAVRLVPIQRLNAVLAISRQPRYLAQLEKWMDQLDRPDQGADKAAVLLSGAERPRRRSGRRPQPFALWRQVRRADRRAARHDRQFRRADADERSFRDGAAEPAIAAIAPAPAQPDNAGAFDTAAVRSRHATITVDKTNNALVIYGTPQQYGVIEAALHKMDVAPIQVQLEVAIAEVTLNDGLQYGVQYFYKPSNEHEFVLSNSASAAIAPAFPGFSYLFTEGSNIQVILSALSSVTMWRSSRRRS